MSAVVSLQVPALSGFCKCDPCYNGPHCEQLCSDVGTCELGFGICNCGFDGGRGEHCELLGCPGLYNIDCSGHGTCGIGESDNFFEMKKEKFIEVTRCRTAGSNVSVAEG